MNANVTTGMNISAGIIYVFSFFLYLIFHEFLLNTRKKNSDLLMIQGMSVRATCVDGILGKHVNWLFCNNRRYFVGISFFEIYFINCRKCSLVMEDSFKLLFSDSSILITFGSFILLFFFISLFVSYILRSEND